MKLKRILAFALTLILVMGLFPADAVATEEYSCNQEEHTHDDSCYAKEPSCGKEVSEGHKHGPECDGTEKEQICKIPEHHQHSQEANCFELVTQSLCQIPADHVHTAEAGCYEMTAAYSCENTEEGHTHDDTCPSTQAATEKVICQIEANHVHNETCPSAEAYSDKVVCTIPADHVHGEECYALPLICGKEEAEGHQHVRDCYPISCGKKEHKHDDSCIAREEAPEKELTFYEKLMASASAEELYDLLLVEGNVPDALTAEEIQAVLAHLETLPYEDEESYDDAQRILAMLLQMVQKDSVCAVCGGTNGQHNGRMVLADLLSESSAAAPKATDIQEGKVYFNKTLVEDENENMAIQIDAWTEGTSSATEIVLVVDQSASMYQTAGSTEVYSATNPEGYFSISDFLAHNPKGNERSEVPGYYVAVTKRDDGTKTSLIRWNPTANKGNGQWEVSKPYDETNGDAAFDVLNPSTPIPNINNSKMTWSALSTWNKDNTKTTRLYKSLFGATIDAFYTLVDQVKDLPNAKIGLVGFSSPPKVALSADNTMGGTGVFSKISDDEVEFKHTEAVTDDELYAAMIPASENELIKTAIRSLRSNYGGTCTEEGFNLANRIFEVSKDKNKYQSNDEVNRVVVLFTDGAPTCYSESTDTYQPKNTEKYAIRAAYTSKDTYGALVYAYANRAVESVQGEDQIPAGEFMDYISSNYPTANYDGKKLIDISADDKKADTYKGYSDNAQDMLDKFTELGQTIFKENNTFNTETEIRDTVTPYFDIGGDYNGSNITVLQVPYNGTDFDDAKATTLYYGKDDPRNTVTLNRMTVTYKQELVKPNGDKETVDRTGEQIKVSGYDYGKNTVFPNVNKGAKLRLIIPILPSHEFVGGNWANTNSSDSGIFPDGNINSPPVSVNGKPSYFEPPHADDKVEEDQVVEADVRTRAGASYLEEISFAELLKHLTIGIDYGTDNTEDDLVLKMGEENYGLKKEDLWRLDYVFMETHLYDSLVDADGNLVDEEGNLLEDGEDPVKNPNKELKAGDTLTIRRDHAVIAEVFVWPRYTYVDGKPVLQTEKPEGLKPVTGIIELTVYYPTFVFADRTLYHGQPLAQVTQVWGSAMEATRYLSWYSNQEYGSLANPEAKPVSTEYPNGYEPLPPQTIGNVGDANITVNTEVPKVYFKVDPIDITVDNEKKSEPVDEGFHDKFGDIMGKESVAMNVRVYFTNAKDGTYDPTNPPLENSMRNAFFLHTRGPSGSIVPKHTSGSSKSDTTYWIPEFHINPEFCQLTIWKTGGIPNETYVFNVSRGLINEYLNDKDHTLIQTETEPTYYTTVSVTTDANGNGSVTLYELPVGVYTVEEDMNWSWRFDTEPEITWAYGNGTEGEGKKIYLLPNDANDDAVVTVTNKDPDDHWLSGMSAVVKNIFGVKRP